eukprot:Platyproteum_vivax@DN5472_c0_g1_i2.p1
METEASNQPTPAPQPETKLENVKQEILAAEDKKPSISEPEVPCNTLYIRNLPSKIFRSKRKCGQLKDHLEKIFRPFGYIKCIDCRHTFFRRGQAWVTFNNIEHARKARADMQDFPFFHKPMTIQFSREVSDPLRAKLGLVPGDPKERREKMQERRKKVAQEHQKRLQTMIEDQQRLMAQINATTGEAGAAPSAGTIRYW